VLLGRALRNAHPPKREEHPNDEHDGVKRMNGLHAGPDLADGVWFGTR